MVDDRAAGADEGTESLVGWWRELFSIDCIRSVGGVVFKVSREGGVCF